AVAFVRSHPRVLALVGAPVTVGEPEGEVPTAGGPAQANLDVVVSGPAGIGRVDLVMARMGRRWEVLTAALTAEGERVLLRGDGSRDEPDSDDDVG
ncbi:MAG TPA: cytochrome c oxidase assembly factor Coa1 family protein, partial [Miltoncostaeaceae bacterium]|nr:cytochrome c oxidase assembly factor Coa1 family protein [Miltoncostaeaceae bacterium]